ncbi:HAD family hydrolase [Streptomyces sp. NPDC002574]|uniref:HAD family hydrolase n=1 Tax=Streptomyces sp. NPDC002574 TaxID=3364652 RepID=UPI0036AD9175
MIRAVVFDVGECLVDDTREYESWADWFGVPRHTFHAMFGVLIAQGRDHRAVFHLFRPGSDLDEEREKRAAAGKPEFFGEEDLYPDVRSVLAALRGAGLWLGIAANQTVRGERLLRGLFAGDVDAIGTSAGWGVGKPDPEFFARVGEAVPFPVGEILYVGDRLDHDVVPAAAAGMRTALVRRGPWALTQWRDPEAGLPTFRVEGLSVLPEEVAKWNTEAR